MWLLLYSYEMGLLETSVTFFVPIDASVLIMTILWVCGSAGKESACNTGDLGSIPGLGRSPGEGKGYPLQYSGLESFMGYSPRGGKELDTTE